MRMELNHGRFAECFNHAMATAKILSNACRGFSSYPSFMNLFVKLLVELSTIKESSLRLRSILEVIGEGDGSWL